jgi:PKHD-type hydroxylase
MNLRNYWWSFKSALPPKLCDDIIEYALSKPEVMARTGDYEKAELAPDEILNLQKKRKSDVVWLEDNWIYKEIIPYINKANIDANWNFQWERSEACQFTKYKLNQYYDWHCDSWEIPYNKPGTLEHGMIRKLSVTCQLTDGSEYTGGELQFDPRSYDPNVRDQDKHVLTSKEILPKGSIVVFPSFVWHRVKPVTAGTRYSLVVWNIGYPFK